jgi:HTH-type transcriptional regulator / antitoxin MqsA
MIATSDKVICAICGNGHLDSRVKKHVVEYRGAQHLLDVEYSICDGCGSEQAAGNQLRNNKRAMIRFKKTVDGLLTGKEVRAIRERLKLSQSEAARVFGGGPVAFSKYESDDVAQSEAMDKMIRLAGDLPSAFEYLAKQAGITQVSVR